MLESPLPWNSDKPLEKIWMVSIVVFLLKKALAEAEGICQATREKGRQHGQVLARQKMS